MQFPISGIGDWGNLRSPTSGSGPSRRASLILRLVRPDSGRLWHL